MKRPCLVTDEKGDHELINYLIPVIAAVLMLLILAVIPLKMATKLLVKVVVVSLLIFVLTYFLYSVYSLYVAGAGFIFLLLYFSYLISRQQGFASKQAKVYSPALDVPKPKQETSREPTAVAKKKSESSSSFGRLDQEGIDALMKAAAADEAAKEEEESPSAVEADGDQHEDNKLGKILSPESDPEKAVLSEINSFETETAATVDYHQDETNLAAEIESALKDFQMDHEALTKEKDLKVGLFSEEIEDFLEAEAKADEEHRETEVESEFGFEPEAGSQSQPQKAVNESIQLFDIEIIENDEELEEIFLGRNRDVILADEEFKKEVVEDELVIYDRSLTDEIKTSTESKEVVSEHQKRYGSTSIEPDKKLEKQTTLKDEDLKASLLQKRSNLFAELEDDL